MTFERQIGHCIEQRMPGADEACKGLARRCYEWFLKGDAFVTWENRFAGSVETRG